MSDCEKHDLNALQRMFRQACVFADVSTFCEKENGVHSLPLDTYSVPGIVNAAFSCEIFIKLLLKTDANGIKIIKTHRLCKLWEMYKIKDKTTALQIEEAIMRNYTNGDLALFRDKLSIVSNSFDDWRYIYEKSSIQADRNFIGLFRDVLREYCCFALYKKTWIDFIMEGYKWYESRQTSVTELSQTETNNHLQSDVEISLANKRKH